MHTYRPQEINIVFNQGGLGDHLCRLPALNHLVTTYPHISVHLYAPTFLHPVITHLDIPRVRLHPLDGWRKAPPRPSYWFGDGFSTSMGQHLVDQAYGTFLDMTPVGHQRNYLPLFKAIRPRKQVVLTPGYTSPARSLPATAWNAIARHCVERGYQPIWLGKKEVDTNLTGYFDEGVDYSVGWDLRDNTTLLEAAQIMAESAAVVGLDNGLIHLAGMTEAPIVVGYTTQLPRYRLPIRNGMPGYGCVTVVPEAGVCFGCETNIRFEFNHDFRRCFYGHYNCIKDLTPARWVKALDLQLALYKDGEND